MAKPRVIARFPTSVILPLIGTEFVFEHTSGNQRHSLSLNGQRFAIFQKGTKCVSCGRRGREFRFEMRPDGKLHLCLYSNDNVMMTRDHIVPRSKYHLVYGTNRGRDSIDNFQTMCERCNSQKSDKMPVGAKIVFADYSWGEDNWII